MISVTMPAYNASKYIRETLDSLLAQTYKDFEIIVVDDGSTDDTVQIVEEYVKKDDRVRLIKNEHGGVSVARNTGVEAAKYPWVAIMDSDDIAMPNRLERQLEEATKDPEVVLWASHVLNIGPNGEKIDIDHKGPASKEEFHKIRAEGGSMDLKHPTIMFRREDGLKVGGYDSRFDSAEDAEFFERMADLGPVVSIPEPLVGYRRHGSSLTMNKFAFQVMVTRYLVVRNQARLNNTTAPTWEAYQEDYKNLDPLTRLQYSMDDRSRMYWRLASMQYSSHNYPMTVFYVLLSLVFNPMLILGRLWDKKLKYIFNPNAQQVTQV